MASEMEEIAKRVRQMRTHVKTQAEHQGIDLGQNTLQSYYMNGKIQGLTDVLIMIDPNPFN